MSELNERPNTVSLPVTENTADINEYNGDNPSEKGENKIKEIEKFKNELEETNKRTEALKNV
jgi:hypothetical protein